MTAAPRAAVVSDGAPCRNCGAPAPGADCAACGQETRGRLPTLREFGREAALRAFALLMLYLPLAIAMIGVLIMAAVVIG